MVINTARELFTEYGYGNLDGVFNNSLIKLLFLLVKELLCFIGFFLNILFNFLYLA